MHLYTDDKKPAFIIFKKKKEKKLAMNVALS